MAIHKASTDLFCSLRHGTPLSFSTTKKNVFRRFPLPEKLLEVDIGDWDGQAPLPHRFYDHEPFDSQRVHSLVPTASQGYPSVTAIISCIGPKEGLYRWEMNQIRLLGQAGFRAQSKQRMETSRKLHKLIESSLKHFCLEEGQIKPKEQIMEENGKNGTPSIPEGYLHSALSLLNRLLGDIREPERKHICYEQFVYNHRLVYRGVFDALLPINGQFTLVDWKGCTVGSSKAQLTPDEATLHTSNKMQLAAYVGALNSDPDFACHPPVRSAAIVNIFESGREAELVPMGEEEIGHAYEQFKGWMNAFWWRMATAKPIVDRERGEIVDFCYQPAKDSADASNAKSDVKK